MNTPRSVTVSVTLPRHVFDMIEEGRGAVSRSRYLSTLVEEALAKRDSSAETGKKKPTAQGRGR